MAPNSTSVEPQPGDVNAGASSQESADSKKEDRSDWGIVWYSVYIYSTLHVGAVYGFYLLLTQAKWLTIPWLMLWGGLGMMGVTAGAHRLWSHRAYKARLPMRVVLAALNSIAFQWSIYNWARDHRVHHKYSDTDADPHNASRGFFFSHMGWLMVRKHPLVVEKGRQIDLSDLHADAVVMWQRRLYPLLVPIFCFFLPAYVPVKLWGEEPWVAWWVASIFRHVLWLHITWLINSAAHLWGTKPYDKTIAPVQNVYVAVSALGEGWHNYHHAFPWDYKAAELGEYRANVTTAFIDFFAWLGWAHDLKTTPEHMVLRRVARRGDGSHASARPRTPPDVWGWGDADLPPEEARGAHVLRPEASGG